MNLATVYCPASDGGAVPDSNTWRSRATTSSATHVNGNWARRHVSFGPQAPYDITPARAISPNAAVDENIFGRVVHLENPLRRHVVSPSCGGRAQPGIRTITARAHSTGAISTATRELAPPLDSDPDWFPSGVSDLWRRDGRGHTRLCHTAELIDRRPVPASPRRSRQPLHADHDGARAWAVLALLSRQRGSGNSACRYLDTLGGHGRRHAYHPCGRRTPMVGISTGLGTLLSLSEVADATSAGANSFGFLLWRHSSVRSSSSGTLSMLSGAGLLGSLKTGSRCCRVPRVCLTTLCLEQPGYVGLPAPLHEALANPGVGAGVRPCWARRYSGSRAVGGLLGVVSAPGLRPRGRAT